MHWIYLIHEFHNLSWITEINELFHDILIHWDAPVCIYIYTVYIYIYIYSLYIVANVLKYVVIFYILSITMTYNVFNEHFNFIFQNKQKRPTTGLNFYSQSICILGIFTWQTAHMKHTRLWKNTSALSKHKHSIISIVVFLDISQTHTHWGLKKHSPVLNI